MNQGLFRKIVGQFATGVVTVTTADPTTGAMRGVTVNSFTSVSLDPLLVLVCIARDSQSHDMLVSRQFFVVNILARRQIALAERFAGRAPLVSAAFDGVAHRVGAGGAPIIDGSVAWLECERYAVYDGGDHSILVGAILDGALGEEDDPLLFFGSDYALLAWG